MMWIITILPKRMDGIENLGDGVFGYFIYAIPKGMGGYRITLPQNADGSYNTDSIVNIDGQPFTKWIDNPNTRNAVEDMGNSFRIPGLYTAVADPTGAR